MELTEISEDMTEDEKNSIEEFRSNGSPGLAKIEDTDVVQFFNLYIAGNTYGEIAEITKKNKSIILFISQRNKWHIRKMDYLNDLTMHLADKSRQAKLESANTLSLATNAFSKYLSEELQRYIKTGDKTIMENLDSKVFANFLKSIDTLDKLLGNKAGGGAGLPKIDINVAGTNHKVQEKGEGVEITTTTESGDTLSLLANYKKSQDRN